MPTTFKTTLNMVALERRYFIGDITCADGSIKHINQLKDAIDNGELLNILKECATNEFNGSLGKVLVKFNWNISSTLCAVGRGTSPVRIARLLLLSKFVDEQIAKLCDKQ